MTVPNTLSVGALAQYGCQASTTAEIKQAIAYASKIRLDFVALGEGSNVVPQAQVAAFVCLIRSRGIEVVGEDVDHVMVKVAAGENWHDFVVYSLSSNWFGLENLSLIPGSVGAAPVQNIGAYGVEVASLIETVEVVDELGRERVMTAAECDFKYRDSIFKRSGDVTICNVVMRLNKRPAVVTHYPDLRAELAAGEVIAPTPQQVADAVITIRQRKLPDPAVAPNVGSFFKNPVVDIDLAGKLQNAHPHFTTYNADSGMKLSAAQLIDEAGWKEKPAPHVACWPHQPLVLVNTQRATSEDVLTFARAIVQDILARYGVQLELEPSLLP